MKILLLEPDLHLNKLYTEALKSSNYDVKSLIQAQQAIDALDKTRPDLIILEPQLKGHSGVEFLYELRSYADWQSIPVIVHSFIPSETLRNFWWSLESLGVAACLYKPQTSLKQLLAAVRNIGHTANV